MFFIAKFCVIVVNNNKKLIDSETILYVQND